MKPSKNAGNLLQTIKKAIEDHKITTTEYDKILSIANEDGMIDEQEKALLTQLQEMLDNKTVKRVP